MSSRLCAITPIGSAKSRRRTRRPYAGSMRRLRRTRGSPRRRLHRLSARCTPPRSSRRRSTGSSTAAPLCGFGRQPLPARQHQDAMDRPRRLDRRRRWRLARSGLGAAQGSSARVGRITAAWRPGPTTRGFIQKEQPAPTLPKMSRAGNALSAPDAIRARKENPESSASASKTGLDATTAGKRRLNPVGPKALGSRSNHFAEFMRNVVQAAAENTSTFATITGVAPMSTP